MKILNSKYCFFLISFIAGTNVGFAQHKIKVADTTEYKNELIVKNTIGHKFILSNEGDRTYLLIKWPKGLQSIGTIVNNKENGHWYLFDKKGTLRKDVFFSNGEANQVKEFDKKGKLIFKTNFTTNF